MPEKRSSRQQVAIYLLLVFAFSSVFYFLVLRGHSLGAGAGLYVFGIMWCPTLAGITTLKLNGRNLSAMKRSQLPNFRREIGMVFQDFKLIERMTVFENLSFILTILGLAPKEHKKRAYSALRAVSLHHKLNAYPLQLSGGEQQRVAIARALINDPLMLIADEPTGNLDPDLADDILRIFADANLRGSTVLLASHDRDLIQRSNRRVIALDHGRIVEEKQASPEKAAPRSDSIFVNW